MWRNFDERTIEGFLTEMVLSEKDVVFSAIVSGAAMGAERGPDSLACASDVPERDADLSGFISDVVIVDFLAPVT